MMTDPENNSCFGNEVFNQPNTNVNTPTDSDGITDAQVNAGNNSGGVPTDNTNNTNNTHTDPQQGQGAPLLFTPLTAVKTISTNAQIATIKFPTYPANNITNGVFYDYTLISPIIDYTTTRRLSSNTNLFYTFLLQFYNNTNFIPGNVVHTTKVCYYSKPVTPFQAYPERITLNYYLPHIVGLSPIDKTVRGFSITVVDTDSEFGVDIVNVSTIGSYVAITRF